MYLCSKPIGGGHIKVESELTPAKVRKLWIKVLKGTRYIQGDGQLRTLSNKYCCWGVLSDLAVKAGRGHWEGETFVDDSGRYVHYPSKLVLKWAGITHDTELAMRNDEGWSFKKIAYYVEENPDCII